jgi:chromosome segregation ATPase
VNFVEENVVLIMSHIPLHYLTESKQEMSHYTTNNKSRNNFIQSLAIGNIPNNTKINNKLSNTARAGNHDSYDNSDDSDDFRTDRPHHNTAILPTRNNNSNMNNLNQNPYLNYSHASLSSDQTSKSSFKLPNTSSAATNKVNNADELFTIIGELRKALVKEIDHRRALETDINHFKQTTAEQIMALQAIKPSATPINLPNNTNNNSNSSNPSDGSGINRIQSDFTILKAQMKSMQTQIHTLQTQPSQPNNNSNSTEDYNNQIQQVQSSLYKAQQQQQQFSSTQEMLQTQLSQVENSLFAVRNNMKTIETNQNNTATGASATAQPPAVQRYDSSKIDSQLANLESQYNSLQLLVVNHTQQIKALNNTTLPAIQTAIQSQSNTIQSHAAVIERREKFVEELDVTVKQLNDSYPYLQARLGDINQKIAELESIKDKALAIENKLTQLSNHTIFDEIWLNKINGLYITQDRQQTQITQLIATAAVGMKKHPLFTGTSPVNSSPSEGKSSYIVELEETMKSIKSAIKIVDGKITENNTFNKELTERVDSAEAFMKTNKKLITELQNKSRPLPAQLKELENKVDIANIPALEMKIAKLEAAEAKRRQNEMTATQNTSNITNTNNSSSSSTSGSGELKSSAEADRVSKELEELKHSVEEGNKKTNKRVKSLEDSVQSMTKQSLSSAQILNDNKNQFIAIEETLKKHSKATVRLEQKHNELSERQQKPLEEFKKFKSEVKSSSEELARQLKALGESSKADFNDKFSLLEQRIEEKNKELESKLHSEMKGELSKNHNELQSSVKHITAVIPALESELKLLAVEFHSFRSLANDSQSVQSNFTALDSKLNKLIAGFQNLVTKVKSMEESSSSLDAFRFKLNQCGTEINHFIAGQLVSIQSSVASVAKECGEYKSHIDLAVEAHSQLHLNAKEMDLLTCKLADQMAETDYCREGLELLAKTAKIALPKKKDLAIKANNNPAQLLQ